MSLAASVTARAALGRRIFPRILATLVLAACAQPATADEKQPPQAAVRTLQGDDAQQVAALTKTIDRLKSAGQFAEAVEPARKIVAICQKALGPEHWQAADARRAVADLRTIAALPEEGRKAMATVEQVRREAIAASEAARYAEADRLSRRVLETCQRWLGEDHPSTIGSYKDLAVNLSRQGKPADAEPLLRKALAISRKALGEDHPSTAYA
jgi:hypothetical protein